MSPSEGKYVLKSESTAKRDRLVNRTLGESGASSRVSFLWS